MFTIKPVKTNNRKDLNNNWIPSDAVIPKI